MRRSIAHRRLADLMDRVGDLKVIGVLVMDDEGHVGICTDGDAPVVKLAIQRAHDKDVPPKQPDVFLSPMPPVEDK